ncbi:GerMN domain-containing protein [Paenibacillus sp. HB172176]|uniref:GerMN domain-containing protein n=1 Tax=Paenibacillus sp. HB172176 TaxID=2493690 RepID=UPI0014387C78|nr:GerMN domain-containing protein [Paenibacillus sp. HB172176]
MIQKRWIRHTALAASLLLLPAWTAGCGLFSQQTSKAIDPPQVETTDGIDGDSTGSLDSQGDVSSLTVYLQDRNGYLAPVSLPASLKTGEEPGQLALEMMVDNGSYASELPDDFRAMIPQGTQILSYETQDGIAMVNFSSPFVDYSSDDERSIVEAITWTLTAMNGVTGVELSVDGEHLTEMPVAGYPMDEDLTRAIGINIETADGVNMSNSSPVTLYFSAQTMDDDQYYVPVTRLIARSDSRALAAMEELIAGPLNKKELTSVIMPDVVVNSIDEKDGVVTIDLSDDSYEAGQKMPSEMLQAIVLSLTDNTSATSVQIEINGETNIVDTQDNSYSAPVSRPHHVNALKS